MTIQTIAIGGDHGIDLDTREVRFIGFYVTYIVDYQKSALVETNTISRESKGMLCVTMPSHGIWF